MSINFKTFFSQIPVDQSASDVIDDLSNKFKLEELAVDILTNSLAFEIFRKLLGGSEMTIYHGQRHAFFLRPGKIVVLLDYRNPRFEKPDKLVVEGFTLYYDRREPPKKYLYDYLPPQIVPRRFACLRRLDGLVKSLGPLQGIRKSPLPVVFGDYHYLASGDRGRFTLESLIAEGDLPTKETILEILSSLTIAFRTLIEKSLLAIKIRDNRISLKQRTTGITAEISGTADLFYLPRPSETEKLLAFIRGDLEVLRETEWFFTYFPKEAGDLVFLLSKVSKSAKGKEGVDEETLAHYTAFYQLYMQSLPFVLGVLFAQFLTVSPHLEKSNFFDYGPSLNSPVLGVNRDWMEALLRMLTTEDILSERAGTLLKNLLFSLLDSDPSFRPTMESVLSTCKLIESTST